MTRNDPPVEPVAGDPQISWREAAVARSLDSARVRAENRVQRFLDAALELTNEAEGGKDFTVQEVVDRSGQSLRTFYQYFGGKRELLLAVFEESVRSATEVLRQEVAGEDDPLERLHRFVVEYYKLCRPAPRDAAPMSGPTTPAMIEFALQLLTRHPSEASVAFAPLATLFGEVLDDAAAAGAVRPGIRRSPVAGMVLEAIMFNVFSTTIGGASAVAEDGDPAGELWDLILHGIGTGGSD